MDTKKVNKYKVTKNKIEFLCEAHLKQIIEENFSKVENIIPLLKNIKDKRKQEFLHLDKEDFYYDFKSGFVFSNPDNDIANISIPTANTKDKKITREIKNGINSNEHNSDEIYENEMKRADSSTLKAIFGTVDIPGKCKGKIIYVNKKATGSSTGKNWANAFINISEAITSSKEKDQIWIAEGKYIENLEIDNKKIEIYGGFKGNEKKGWQKKNHKVVLQGKVIIRNAGYNTKLSGIEISGYSNSISKNERDATAKITYFALHIINSTPIINNCKINNIDISSYITSYRVTARSEAAGIYNQNSNSIIINCTIDNCEISASARSSDSYYYARAYSYGGGIYNYNSNPVIIDTTISNCNVTASATNSRDADSGSFGGGIYNYNSSKAKLINVQLNNNSPQNICNKNSNSEAVKMPFVELESEIKQFLSSYIISKELNTILDKDENIIYQFVKNGFIGINCEKNEDYAIISNALKYEDNKLNFDTNFLFQQFRNNKLKGKIAGKDFNWKTLLQNITNGKIPINSQAIIDDLVNVDFYRANIEKYDKKILTEINRGHWDLWDNNIDKDILIKIDEELIARNPKEDIHESGIVGIDFGTKSTVVVYQKDSDISIPMQIGSGDFKKEIEESDFENPTILQFINLDNFIKSYKEKAGRPFTLWSDITTSHTAMSQLQESKSEDYYSFFYGLKQWAGGDNKKLLFKDKQKKTIEIPEYKKLTANDFDPIEIYAYYIGSYINTLRNGIFLNYILSYPESYDKDIVNRLVKSFEKGIKKSLPTSILNDTNVMKNFSVTAGTSEPAAYAISALNEYNLDPEGDKKIYYGIFDFGGGTTDFDFGIWREDTDDESLIDYIIEHFGGGFDRYLGGENLLEYLSFEIFKSNQDILREKDIRFYQPPECNETPSIKALLSESQEAKLNMRFLMEKIRPIWEKKEEQHKEVKNNNNKNKNKNKKSKPNVAETKTQPEKDSSFLKNGVLKVSLTNSQGEVQSVELKINEKNVEKMIKTRIEKGVQKFFATMKKAFLKEKDIKEINIFLAGNSSKSLIVQSLFNEYIKNNETQKIKYKLFKPLSGKIDKHTENVKPNGKTGVAFGIIEGREGGTIKVVNKNRNEDNQSKFQFYLGRKKKKTFKKIINRDVEYNRWYKFIPATQNSFEIYYTSNPLVDTSTISIQETKRILIKNENTGYNHFIYVKIISPTNIEWIVSQNNPKQDVPGKEIYLSE